MGRSSRKPRCTRRWITTRPVALERWNTRCDARHAIVMVAPAPRYSECAETLGEQCSADDPSEPPVHLPALEPTSSQFRDSEYCWMLHELMLTANNKLTFVRSLLIFSRRG